MGDRSHPTHSPNGLAERYSSTAAEYARFWSPVIRPMGQRLVRALPLADAHHVLDIGTGVGALVSDIQAAAPHALVVGVDGAPGMLRVARASVPVPLAAMDARRLGLQSGSFDAAVMAFVLFHLPDPVRGLIEIGRVLRPGGALGVTTWGSRPGFTASAVWDETLAVYGAGPDPVDSADRDDLMDTPEKLDALLVEAGFEAVDAWSECFEHRWDAETLMAQRVGWGSYQRRLETLDAATRDACLARVQERLAALAADDFVYRPEINFAVGRFRGQGRRVRSPPRGHLTDDAETMCGGQ